MKDGNFIFDGVEDPLIAVLNLLSPVGTGGGNSTHRDSMLYVFFYKAEIAAERSSGRGCTIL